MGLRAGGPSRWGSGVFSYQALRLPAWFQEGALTVKKIQSMGG